MVQYVPKMADQYEVVYDLSISAIFNDVTHISRSRQYSTLNTPLMVQARHVFGRGSSISCTDEFLVYNGGATVFVARSRRGNP